MMLLEGRRPERGQFEDAAILTNPESAVVTTEKVAAAILVANDARKTHFVDCEGRGKPDQNRDDEELDLIVTSLDVRPGLRYQPDPAHQQHDKE